MRSVIVKTCLELYEKLDLLVGTGVPNQKTVSDDIGTWNFIHGVRHSQLIMMTGRVSAETKQKYKCANTAKQLKVMFDTPLFVPSKLYVQYTASIVATYNDRMEYQKRNPDTLALETHVGRGYILGAPKMEARFCGQHIVIEDGNIEIKAF